MHFTQYVVNRHPIKFNECVNGHLEREEEAGHELVDIKVTAGKDNYQALLMFKKAKELKKKKTKKEVLEEVLKEEE